ncbi:hypothetical protein, partial [Pseudomonas gessardii]|uniref:hypothetical protein n=1 Tax=Pseudomonas gessardii TaxID=78544 RepID=UPI001F20E42C
VLLLFLGGVLQLSMMMQTIQGSLGLIMEIQSSVHSILEFAFTLSQAVVKEKQTQFHAGVLFS